MVAINRKKAAKPEVVDYEALYKAEKAKTASLEAEVAVKAARPKASKRTDSPFSAEDVISMTAEDWKELSGEFYVRKTDGSFVPTITRTGGTRVTMKPGLDYGVYRFIKGIGRQMSSNSFEELSDKQVAACRNILAYCLDKDLVEAPEGAVAKRKPGRPSKKAAAAV